jgi:hypothetical protein
MKHARERLSKGMVIYGGEMEIKRELLEFGRFVHEAVHDAFVYLAEVFCVLFQSRSKNVCGTGVPILSSS